VFVRCPCRLTDVQRSEAQTHHSEKVSFTILNAFKLYTKLSQFVFEILWLIYHDMYLYERLLHVLSNYLLTYLHLKTIEICFRNKISEIILPNCLVVNEPKVVSHTDACVHKVWEASQKRKLEFGFHLSGVGCS